MKNFARWVVGSFILSMLLLSFQNCASYSENSLFESKSVDVVDLSRPSLGAPVYEFQQGIDLRNQERSSRLLVLKGQCYTGGTSEASLSLTLETTLSDGRVEARNLCGLSQCSVIQGIRCNQGTYIFMVQLDRDMTVANPNQVIARSYRGNILMNYRSPAGGVASSISSFFHIGIID